MRWVILYLLLCLVCLIGLYSGWAALGTAIGIVLGWVWGWHRYLMRAWEIGFFYIRREQVASARRMEALDDEAEEELKDGLRDVLPID